MAWSWLRREEMESGGSASFLHPGGPTMSNSSRTGSAGGLGLRPAGSRYPGSERPVEIGLAPAGDRDCPGSGQLARRTSHGAVPEGHGGVSLIDVSNPAHPALIARASLGRIPKINLIPKSGGWAHGIAWSGQYLFVANWKRGLTVVDVQDLQTPRIAVEYNTGERPLGFRPNRSRRQHLGFSGWRRSRPHIL